MPAAAHTYGSAVLGSQALDKSASEAAASRDGDASTSEKARILLQRNAEVMNPLLPKTLAALAHICPRSRPLSLQTHLHNSASSSASVRRLKASAGTAVKLAERVNRDSKAELLCAVEPLASSMPPTAWACQCQTQGARTSQGQRSKH